MGTDPEAAVAVGIVSKPLGLRGECYVRADPDVTDGFPVGRCYGVNGGPTGVTELCVATSRLHGNRQVVHFKGLTDRSAVELLRGAVLTRPRGEIALDEDAFWADELLGRDVVDDNGALIGVVESVRDGAAHDYLVIARPDGGEILLPAVTQLLHISADTIVVHVIPGLIDD